MDRQSIYQSINDAKKLMLSMKPIAVILKLKFADDHDFESHFDVLKHQIFSLYNRLKKASPSELPEISSQVDEIITGIYENNITLQIMKKLLFFQSCE